MARLSTITDRPSGISLPGQTSRYSLPMILSVRRLVGLAVVAMVGCSAPSTDDSGTPMDSGMPVDSGTPSDSGTPVDAGMDAGAVDSGTPSDAGMDAGVAFDAGTFDAQDGARSGTRLKLRWADFGGTRQIFDVYDTTVGATCSAWPFTDGNTYCTPQFGNVVYSNAACTTAVGITTPGCGSPPSYFASSTYTNCDPRHGDSQLATLFTPGPVVTPPKFYANNSGSSPCAEVTLAPNSVVYSLTPVALSSLAQLTPQTATATGRFAQTFLTSTDGLKLPTQLSDSTLNIGCTPLSTNGTTSAACLLNARQSQFYSDATCMTPAIGVNNVCAAPAYAVVRDDTCAVDTYRAVSVGSQIPSNSLHGLSGTTCGGSGGPSNYTYYSTTATVAMGSVGRRADTTGHAIELMHLYEANSRFRDSVLYDSAHHVECYPDTFADGSYHCVPNTDGTRTYFSDMTCQTAVDIFDLRANPSGCNTAPVPATVYKFLSVGQCGYDFELHAVLGQYQGTLFDLASGSCAATTDPSTHYALGPVLPQTEFPAATIVQDP